MKSTGVLLAFLLPAIMLTSTSAPAQTPASDTLRLNIREILDRAMSANLDLRESQLERDRALADQYEADMARFLPVFQVEGYASVVKDAVGYVTQHPLETSWSRIGPYVQLKGELGQPLTTFGRVTSLRSAARFGVRAQEAGIEVRRAQVTMEIYRYYYGVLLARELLDILRDASDKLDQAKRRTRELLDEGSEAVTTVDINKLDVYGFELERKHIEAEKNIRLALGALRRAAGIPHATYFDIEDGRLRPLPQEIPALDTLQQLALARRAEIDQVNAGVEARLLQLRAAEAERWPVLFLGADFNLRYAPGRDFLTENPFVGDAYNGQSVRAALGMRYQLGLSDREAKIRRARVDYREMLRKREWARTSIALEVQKAWEETVEAQQASVLGRRSLAAGRGWLVQTSEQYDIGVASARDLLEAYGAYAKSQSDYYMTLYDHYLALAELCRVVGRPIWEIDAITNPVE